MQFDVERARADGLSEEEIQALIAAGPPPELTEEITTEEVVVTPEPPQASPKTESTFDVERARADGLTDVQIQEAIAAGPPQASPKTESTFDVERARADGLSDIEIQEAIAAGPPKENQQPTQQLTQQPTQPTGDKEYAGFFESAFGALGDYFDIASVGSSALLPGGETTDEAARRFLKESETKPARSRFSFADIEKAWSEGGMEGLKETIQQMPGGLGEAIGMIGPSIAAGAVGFALGGPLGAILAIAASSAAPQMGGNVVEQATADLEAGRP